jgi:hypothetical protein
MTSIGNSKVSKRSVAVILTICYWIATLAFAGFEAMRDPNSLGFYVIGFGVLFAAPVTLILLLVVFIDRLVLGSRLPAFGLIAVGVAVPITYILVVYTIPHERQANETQRMVAQSDVAIVGSVTDDVLMDSKGPIGVRLSYQITYPKGLELDPAKAPQAYLRAQDGNGKSVSFLPRTRVVIPAVSNRFPPGTYTITNDFPPAFLPVSLLPSTDWERAATVDEKGNQRAALPDNCFRWVYWEKRPDIERTDPQLLTVSISTALATTKSMMTTHVYRMDVFLKTADQEGAIDCGIVH